MTQKAHWPRRRDVEGLKHDLGHALSVGLWVERRLGQKHRVLLRRNAQLVVEPQRRLAAACRKLGQALVYTVILTDRCQNGEPRTMPQEVTGRKCGNMARGLSLTSNYPFGEDVSSRVGHPWVSASRPDPEPRACDARSSPRRNTSHSTSQSNVKTSREASNPKTNPQTNVADPLSVPKPLFLTLPKPPETVKTNGCGSKLGTQHGTQVNGTKD